MDLTRGSHSLLYDFTAEAHRLDESIRYPTYLSGFLTYVSEATLLPCCWPSKNMHVARQNDELRVKDEGGQYTIHLA